MLEFSVYQDTDPTKQKNHSWKEYSRKMKMVFVDTSMQEIQWVIMKKHDL